MTTGPICECQNIRCRTPLKISWDAFHRLAHETGPYRPQMAWLVITSHVNPKTEEIIHSQGDLSLVIRHQPPKEGE